MRSPDDAAEVLLIEDSPDDAAFFIHTLNRSGVSARLHVVSDGAAALDFIFGPGPEAKREVQHRPRLIVLDLKLPKVDGLGVLRALKSDPRTLAIPVVVLSSSHEGRDVIASYRQGVNSYVVKPMDFDQYGETVTSLARYWLQINQTPEN